VARALRHLPGSPSTCDTVLGGGLLACRRRRHRTGWRLARRWRGVHCRNHHQGRRLLALLRLALTLPHRGSAFRHPLLSTCLLPRARRRPLIRRMGRALAKPMMFPRQQKRDGFASLCPSCNPRHAFAFSRPHLARALPINSPPQLKEGAGKTGCRPGTHGPLCERWQQESAQRHTGVAKTSGLPCAVGLRLMSRSPRGALHYCPRRLADD